MRGHRRPRWSAPLVTTLLAGLTPLAVTLTIAPGAAAVTAATADPITTSATGPRTVVLATGQRITLAGPAGREDVLVDDAGPAGPGRTLVSRRLGGRLYLLPAVAEPYLGRFIEPGLFDVTDRAATTDADQRVPVRLAYTGATPAVPGVRITAAADGIARGYLTPASAIEFGRALAAQWQADERAGWPARSSLFGVSRIGAGGPATGPVSPRYPMRTLTVRTVGPDGGPVPHTLVGLMNVEDGRKYTGFVNVENGTGVVSVPDGTYSLIGDVFGFDQATSTTTLRISTVNQFTVTGSGQTVTLDHRNATVTPSVSTPKPAAVSGHYLEWSRRDQPAAGWISSGYFLDPRTQVSLSPSSPATVGSVSLVQNWNLTGPATGESYGYDLASQRDHVPATLADDFTEADLATIRGHYHGDGTTAPAAMLRYARYPTGGGAGAFRPTPRGTVRTEYVAATGTPAWTDSARLNAASTSDQGTLDGAPRRVPAGSQTDATWFRGPLGAGFPDQPGEGECYACRSGDTLLLALAPFTDSDPTHRGSLQTAPDGVPVARFQLFQDDTLVSDQPDVVGGRFPVAAGKATYRAVLDVDRRLSAPGQSTRSTTEVTFTSAPGAGTALPSNWACALDGCTVLPIVQARVSLPTGLDGTLPAGPSTVSVDVARIQGAGTATSTTAALEIRPEGGDWTRVPLVPGSAGPGHHEGVLDNVAPAGTVVDLRVSGADESGGEFRQTVLRAYTVAGS